MNGKLPTTLDGVTVKTPSGTSSTLAVNFQYGPAFFVWPDNFAGLYPVALRVADSLPEWPGL